MNISPIITAPTLSPSKWNEEIVVIKRELLFAYEPAWQGIKKVDTEFYSNLIYANKEVMLRGPAEGDITYKQIIPYVIFKHQDNYFLMQRSNKSSEKRLADKYTLGIGGHLQADDVKTNDLIEWGKREFNEEIQYESNLSYEVLGILNDDSNDVGKVHIGIVICATGDSDEISIRSELAMGTLVNLETCIAHFNKLETWSQYVVTFLQNS
jgi:predicted NUDIX family phosphoesterase